KVERQMEAVKQCPTNRFLLSSAWGSFIYRHRRARFTPTPLWRDLSPVEWLIRKMGQNLYMQTATWLASRDLVDSAGKWDTQLAVDDDGEYFCRAVAVSDGVRFVPEARVFYRTPRLDSLSVIGASNAKLNAQFRSMQLAIGYLRSLEES